MKKLMAFHKNDVTKKIYFDGDDFIFENCVPGYKRVYSSYCKAMAILDCLKLKAENYGIPLNDYEYLEGLSND